MIEQRYKLPEISLTAESFKRPFNEAYLEFYGLNHLRPSFIAWVFFTNQLPKKVTSKSRGGAGSFGLFGHSECWGETGHCHGPDGLRRFDSRPSHPMTTAFKRVPVSHALKKKIESGSEKLDVWVYAFSREVWPNREERSLISCKSIQLVTL